LAFFERGCGDAEEMMEISSRLRVVEIAKTRMHEKGRALSIEPEGV
jgi:hypothetical protein